MALARMCKARIAVHNTAANELAGKLQNLGCCEFSGVGEGTLEVGAAVAMRAKEDHLNSLLSDVKFLVRLLEPFETNKESSFAQMLGDIPEVSLVAVLDADKEGFLRSTRSLIQIAGRAARNSEGTVIMYADSVTPSMKVAITETQRRREIQNKYNVEHGIVPKTIV